MTLYSKIFTTVLICFIAAISFVTICMTDRHVEQAEKILLEKQSFIGMTLTSEIQRWQSQNKWPFMALNTLASHDGFHFWWIVDNNGAIYLANDAAFMGTLATSYFEDTDPGSLVPREQGQVLVIAEKHMSVFSQSFSVGHTQWSFWFGTSIKEIQNTKKQIVTFAAVAVFFSTFFLMLILFFIIRFFLNPLQLLNNGLKEIGKGNLTFQFGKMPDDELGALAGSVNNMARQLEIRATERDLVEKELHQLQNYLSNIIDSMPSMLIGVDTKGNVTQWNIRASQITGLTSEEAIGQPFIEAIPHLADKINMVNAAIKTQKSCVVPRQRNPKEASTIYEDITIYPLIANGVEGAVIRVDDVSDKVRMEEMMVQSEKMLSVGGLAAGMAHEINNPLAGMMQTAQVMRSRLEDRQMNANLCAAKDIGISIEDINAYMENRGIFKMMEAITESGIRISEIIKNMLSFARQSDATVSSHNPVQLIDKILELAATDYNLKKQYDFKSIEIIKEYDDNLPMVCCEGAKIQQVMLNLLQNGAQAMLEFKDQVDFNPQFILRLSHEKEINMLRIEIQDNGPGIDKEIQSRIFDPFFTTKPVGVGTGLGLSVSYFIITETHKGSMKVVSQPGKGSNFIIHLPLQ